MDPMKITQMAQDYTKAWNSKSAKAVASFYAEDGGIVINKGDPWSGRDRVEEMAAGFFRDVPDLSLTCDVRVSDTHVLFAWTFTGHDATTGNPLKVHGWEEWDLNEQMQVQASKGWFDAKAYDAQANDGQSATS